MTERVVKSAKEMKSLLNLQTLTAVIQASPLNVSQIAAKIGIQPRTLYAYLDGKRSPSTKSLVKLAKVLGVGVDSLLN